MSPLEALQPDQMDVVARALEPFRARDTSQFKREGDVVELRQGNVLSS
jgi:hypothetical protein